MDLENDNEKKKKFTLKDWLETKDNLKKSFKYVKNNKKNLIIGAIIALLEVRYSLRQIISKPVHYPSIISNLLHVLRNPLNGRCYFLICG